eukprot:1302738-Ditylum_brightwellii.AAC.1
MITASGIGQIHGAGKPLQGEAIGFPSKEIHGESSQGCPVAPEAFGKQFQIQPSVKGCTSSPRCTEPVYLKGHLVKKHFPAGWFW